MSLKKIIGSSVVMTAMLCMANVTYAQAMKIAFVQNSKIMQSPQLKAVDEKLEKEFSDRIRRAEKNREDFAKMRQKFEADSPTMNQAARSARERDLIEKSKVFSAEENSLNVDLNQRKSEELRVFREKFDRALKKVVEADQLDLVLTDEGGSVLHRSEKIDITAKVLKELSTMK